MSYQVPDSNKPAQNMNGVVPPLRSSSGVLGGSAGYSQQQHSGLFDPASRDSFAQPSGLPPKAQPSFRPSFTDDATINRGSAGDWNSAPARNYNGLPTPSFMGGMEDPNLHAQQPQQPQQIYSNSYNHFDPRYSTASQTAPPAAASPAVRAPDTDRNGFFSHPNLYSNVDGSQHQSYLLDPNASASFDSRQGFPPRQAYHPNASVLAGRSDQRMMLPPDRVSPVDPRYMTGPHQSLKGLPAPSFFDGASSVVPAMPVVQKRPKARIDGSARKRICQFAEVNPEMRQADVAAAFNVERSTVSKILKQKAKWLAYEPDDPETNKAAAASTAAVNPGLKNNRLKAAPGRRQSSLTAISRDPSVHHSPQQAGTRSPATGLPALGAPYDNVRSPLHMGAAQELGMRPPPGSVPSGLPFLNRPSYHQSHEAHSTRLPTMLPP